MEPLIVVAIPILFAGLGIWITLILLAQGRIRDRAARALYSEICRRTARHERLADRGIESPLLDRYRAYREEARRELARLGIPLPSRTKA